MTALTPIRRTTQFSNYLILPREIFSMGLSGMAIQLYALLLDRARLSQTNDGWQDENGDVFANFTINDLAEATGKSDMTVKRTFNELEGKGLIRRRRQGTGKANRLYIQIPAEQKRSTEHICSDKENISVPPDRTKLFGLTEQKCSPNKNNIIKPREKESLSKNPYGFYSNVLLTEEEYSHLVRYVIGHDDYIEYLSREIHMEAICKDLNTAMEGGYTDKNHYQIIEDLAVADERWHDKVASYQARLESLQ